MIYQVEIIETLQRIVSIKTGDENVSISVVKQMYRNEDIVFDNSDYSDTNIDIVLVK